MSHLPLLYDEEVLGALMSLYHRTEGLGFPHQHQQSCLNIATFYKTKRYVTKSQVDLCRMMLKDTAMRLKTIKSLPLDATEKVKPERGKARPKAFLDGDVIRIPRHLVEPIRADFLDVMQGFQFLTSANYYSVGLSWVMMDCLESVDIPMESEILDWRKSYYRGPLKELNLDGIGLQPMEHQPFAIQCLEAQNGGGLLADDMGLGKSFEAIAWTYQHDDALPVALNCPASLKTNWKREFEQVYGKGNLDIRILEGRPPANKKAALDMIRGADVVIANYDIMGGRAQKISSSKLAPKGRKSAKVEKTPGWGGIFSASKMFNTVIFDEGQYLKNDNTARSKACLGFGRTCEHILWLSGTPLEQRPSEIWSAVRTLAPGMFSSKKEFETAFCDGQPNGASHTRILSDWLRRTIMVRRNKKDVLKSLPDKRKCVQVLPMSKSGQKEYNKAEANFINWYRQLKGDEAASRAAKAEHLARLTALRRFSWETKKDSIFEWVENFLDSGEKLVVFFEFKNTGEDMEDFLRDLGVKYVKLDGSTPQKRRMELVDAFQNDDRVEVFLGQFKAAGTGLTLTRASNCVTLNYHWNPSLHNQADDRIHRIGQKRGVSCYYLPAENSIEEDIMEILASKQNVVSNVLDGKDDPTPYIQLVTKLLMKRHGG